MQKVSAATNAATLIDAARQLGELVREHVEEGEQERRLPAALVEAFTDAGIFRMCRPRMYGGLEVDPLTVVQVVEELSRAGGSPGWCAMISGAGSIFEGFVGAEGGKEMFSDPRVVSGGVVAPTGRAIEVEGGYRVTGRWSAASNVHQCQWVGGSCFVFDGDKPRMTPMGPEWVVPFFAASDIKILDTWNVSGLRGTGSHDFEVSDAFVPSRRVIRLPLGNSPHDTPLFRFPFFGFLAMSIASTALGIARAALDELTRVAKAKTPFGMMSTLSTRPSAQIAAAEAEADLGAARAYLLDAVEAVWRKAEAGAPATVEERLKLRMAATNATLASTRAVDRAFTAGGASALYDKSPLQRCFRDVHAITQHATVCPATHELFGRILLGVEPDAPML